MADSNIGALPPAQSVADDSLLVMEQQGTAMKVTGALLKEYAKQGVELEFQEDLEVAQAAADRAENAAGAVVDMTVSAHASETATVTKSMRAGKVNLDFGLPRGEQGVPGPAGQTGPRGPQGAPGNGLTILGYYDTESELRAAVPDPEAGDAYGVGTEAPYDIYVLDGVTGDWKNNGPLSGSGGGVIPENVVTSEGGAILEIQASFGDAPHTISITDEEEPPLTAADVEYDSAATGMEAGTVQEAVDQLFTSVSDGKALIASAVTDKGVPTERDATFAEVAENIRQITTGGDTSDATAAPGDILGGKTAYTASGKVEGIIPSLPAQTITPGTADKTIVSGQYLAGAQTVKGDPNLTSSNIKKGVSLFGVAGALESSFAATLTVKADIGAVVTATCGDTELEVLSTTGTMVLELPIEGTWKVTAVRGMAQYNTVTLEVSNQYSAELTAEVHIEYYMAAANLHQERYSLVSTSVGNYALFGGGDYYNFADNVHKTSAVVDAYDSELTHTKAPDLSLQEYYVGVKSATSVGNYALFSILTRSLDAYNKNLVKTYLADRLNHSGDVAVATGDYALFAQSGSGNTPSFVCACNSNLTVTELTRLLIPRTPVAAANANYALFGGGAYYDAVDAYDKNLTRSTPVGLSSARASGAAVRAGSYVLFAGGYTSKNPAVDTVDAYDLFLTRTTPEPLVCARTQMAAVTINDFALICGGQAFNSQGKGRAVDYCDVYDPFLTRVDCTSLSEARALASAACAGNYALVGGGTTTPTLAAPTSSKVVDVYRYK